MEAACSEEVVHVRAGGAVAAAWWLSAAFEAVERQRREGCGVAAMVVCTR